MSKKDSAAAEEVRFENLVILIMTGAFLAGFGMAALLNILRSSKKSEE